MDDNTSLQASFWMMVFLQTLGAVDMPGRGPRKMPSPRSYSAIIVAWGILQLVTDAGFGRAAKVFSWLLVLAGMVIGPFGSLVSGLFNAVGNQAASQQQPATPPLQLPLPTPLGPRPPGLGFNQPIGFGR